MEKRIVALEGEIESLTTKYNETVAAGHLDGAIAQAIERVLRVQLELLDRDFVRLYLLEQLVPLHAVEVLLLLQVLLQVYLDFNGLLLVP